MGRPGLKRDNISKSELFGRSLKIRIMEVLGYEDVFSKIDLCRAHYEACGLGADYTDQFIR